MSGPTTNPVRLILLLLVFVGAVHAEVRLPAIISDNVVLQQGTKVRIWGNAKPGERVTVTFQNKSTETVGDAQGRWQVFIGPLKNGGPAELTVNSAGPPFFKGPMNTCQRPCASPTVSVDLF